MSVTIIHDSRHADGTRLRTFAYERGDIEHVATHSDGRFAASLHVRYRALTLHAAHRWDEEAERKPVECAFIESKCYSYCLGISAADDVVARAPDNRQVQRLQRLRKVHEMAELRIEAETGKSHGGGAVAGSRDWGIETLLYSPPIDEDWRIFGGIGYATADFEEGTGHHRWQRLQAPPKAAIV